MKANRRRFLTTLGATASATLLAPAVFDFRLLAATSVRPNVSGMLSTDPILVGYQTAITAMQGLLPTDPRSWSYQAAIHYTTAPPTMPDWDNCQHGTHFFWAWHRMYLYWFERIVRKYSGDPNWVLPFWNWTAQPHLPPPFRVTTSDLYTAERDSTINNGSGALPASYVSYTSPFAELDYYTAQGALEGTPHGAVHVGVGGSSGWMSSVPTAAMDPIFYLHHANIDRLWNLYLAQGGGRADPTSDSTWTSRVFHFFDENGKAVSMTPCDVLNAAAQLNYRYEGEPTQVKQSCGVIPIWIFKYLVLLNIQFPPMPIGPDPYTVAVDISKVEQQLANILNNPLQEVFLELDGVATDKQPGATWEVYVGLPAGAVPDPTSPYYVGQLALFGRGVRSDTVKQFQPATVRFNATKALAQVIATGGASAPISFFCKGILVRGKQQAGQPHSLVTVPSAVFRVQTRSRQ
jgi:Common central domain of tyrosinase/Polyphenol oxidase middle domain